MVRPLSFGERPPAIGSPRGKAYTLLAGERVTIEQRVTNVYRRHAGAWKVVHHHADLSREMVDMLARMQKKS